MLCCFLKTSVLQKYSTAQTTTHHNMAEFITKIGNRKGRTVYICEPVLLHDDLAVELNAFPMRFWNAVYRYYSMYHFSNIKFITDYDAKCCMNGPCAYFKDENLENIPNITGEDRETFQKAYAEYQNTPQPLRKFANEMKNFPQRLRANVFKYYRFYHPAALSSITDNDASLCMIGPSAYFKDENVGKIPDITVKDREAFQKAYAEYHQKHHGVCQGNQSW